MASRASDGKEKDIPIERAKVDDLIVLFSLPFFLRNEFDCFYLIWLNMERNERIPPILYYWQDLDFFLKEINLFDIPHREQCLQGDLSPHSPGFV